MPSSKPVIAVRTTEEIIAKMKHISGENNIEQVTRWLA